MNNYINAPEDVTHTYDLVGGYIGFYRLSGGKWSWWDSLSDGWCKVLDNTPFQTPIPIKETNNSVSGILNSSQISDVVKELEENDNKVKYTNGGNIEYANTCKFGNFWNGRYVCFDEFENEHVIENHDGLWHITGDCIRKPETEAEKLQRERTENGKAYYELISSIETELLCPEHHGYPNMWGELRSEWQEVYIRQAEVLGFSKESC